MTHTTDAILTPQDARDLAAQWGSLITAGDPGAVFYSLNGSADQILNEEHRQQLIKYTEECLVGAKGQDKHELGTLLQHFKTWPTAETLCWFTSSSGLVVFQLKLVDVVGCSHSGRCDDDVAAAKKTDYLTKQLAEIDPKRLRQELREYGAWNAKDLSDHQANLDRIVWLAAGEIQDRLYSGEDVVN